VALSSGMWNYHVLPAEDTSPEWLLMLVNGHPAEQLVDEKGKESLLVMERKDVKHHEQTVHEMGSTPYWHAKEAETAACLEGIRLAAGWPHFFSGISFFFASKRESIFHLSLSISK